MGVRYGGLRAHAALRRRAKRDPRVPGGVHIGGDVGFEYRAHRLLAPGTSDDPRANVAVPPSDVLTAWRVVGGYDWHAFGVLFGLGAWQNYHDNRGLFYYDTADTQFPVAKLQGSGSLVVRFGRLDFVRAEAGVGSYDAATLFRPGVWAGVAYAEPSGLECVLRAGHHEEIGVRALAELRVPVAGWLRAKGAVALVTDEAEVEVGSGLELNF